jgi:hypothetical protein
MPPFQAEEQTRLKRKFIEQAISLATQSRWEEAVQANQAIIELFADDVDAYNRLGKALTELGQYSSAKEAYAKALKIDRSNTIARKNLNRLSHLEQVQPSRVIPSDKVEPLIFIEETGKSGTSELYNPAETHVLARMSAGDQVQLQIQGRALEVTNLRGEYLGQVEPKLGLRLSKLMEGGNRYAAAIASLNETRARIVIKETYQHPSQAGRISFPFKTGDKFRPYIKESILHYELEDETEDDASNAEWDGEEKTNLGDESVLDEDEEEPDDTDDLEEGIED